MKLKPKPSIQQADNFFPDNIAIEMAEFVHAAQYRYGETDNTEHPGGRDPVGCAPRKYPS